MTLIIDMASGTEYQGDDLRCRNRQEAPTTDAVTFNDCQQAIPRLQLVETGTTASSSIMSESVIHIDMCALFESNNS